METSSYLGDWLAHRLSLQGVLASFVHASSGNADGASSDWWSRLVESAHGNLEASSLANQHVLLGNAHFFERDATSVTGSLAHIPLLAALGHALPVGLDNEASEGLGRWSLGVRVGAGEHKVPVGNATVRDPHLLAREDVFVALLDGLGLDTGHI